MRLCYFGDGCDVGYLQRRLVGVFNPDEFCVWCDRVKNIFHFGSVGIVHFYTLNFS